MRKSRRTRIATFVATMLILLMLPTVPHQEVSASTTTGDWLQVDAGSNHSCGIKANFTLWCWGSNSEGQIGNGDPQRQICIGGASTPCRDKTKKLWSSVSAGNQYTCAIERTTLKLYCWGYNNYGKLGHRDVNSRGLRVDPSVPNEVEGGGKWASVAAGDTHTCAIKTDKSLWCWGRDDKGQLGNYFSDTSKPIPSRVSTASAASWIDVDVESKQSCAIASTYVMYCWGQWGWVGAVQGSMSDTPSRVNQGAISYFRDWRSVATGRYHVCGIRASGALYCFGKNNAGQIGNGKDTDIQYPVQIVPTQKWSKVELGLDYSCAIKTNGQLWCWGDNYFGQPGQYCGSEWVSSGPRMCDISNQAYPSPVREKTNSLGWATLDAGGFHTCAIKSSSKTSNRLFCWGQDTKAQLGFRYRSPMPGNICTYTGYGDWDTNRLGPSECFLYSPPRIEVENQ